MDLSVVILAAGQGTRMKSSLPKVLHRLAGRPMLQHVVDTAQQLSPINIQVVYGHGGDLVKSSVAGEQLRWVEQKEQLGTGHAVQQALPGLPANGVCLILYGDVPCVTPETLSRLVDMTSNCDIALLTVNLNDPTGYGRIVRNEEGQVKAIVEHKDATEPERQIREINTGIMVVKNEHLHHSLSLIGNNNAQGEYYLTDIISLTNEQGGVVHALPAADPLEVEGVNDRIQLAKLERYFQSRLAIKLMASGTGMADPGRVDIRGNLQVGQDTYLDVNLLVEGDVTIGNNCYIGAQVILKDCTIGDNVHIKDQTIIEGAIIGDECQVGPFARIRPGSRFDRDVHVGNFVEVKNAHLMEGVKSGHLSYLGDASVGKRVNVGAGTITCNYDGANKHKTVIGDDVFVGSDSQLVAPVTIGKGVTIGAGTTVTQDVTDKALVISRVKQREVANWKRPEKKQKD